MILFLVVFCLLVAVGFGIASAVSDFKSMTIPNIYAAGIVLAFVPAFAADALSGHGMEFFASWQSHLAAAGIVFVFTFVLFTLKVMGAGDSKLCSAFALWCGLSGLASFLFYMTIIGAVLGLTTKMMNKRKMVANPAAGSWIAKSQAGEMGVPYGIAICVGAIIAFWQLGYFSPEKIALLANYTENLSGE
jgi:prepilin peptidase CpaA